jgi:hypothetical protein
MLCAFLAVCFRVEFFYSGIRFKEPSAVQAVHRPKVRVEKMLLAFDVIDLSFQSIDLFNYVKISALDSFL